jgi:hypothetical protein
MRGLAAIDCFSATPNFATDLSPCVKMAIEASFDVGAVHSISFKLLGE